MTPNISNDRPRLVWADYVKAIAIILMVCCHFMQSNTSSFQVYLHQAIYTFHIPAFFVIAGFFEKGLKRGVKHRVLPLLIPYFFFSMIALTTCWVSPYLHPELYYNVSIWKSILNAIVGMFLMDDCVRSWAFMPSGPLWFLIALIWVKLIFYVLTLLCGKRKIFLLFIFLAFLIYIYQLHIPLFSIDSAILSLPFYVFGYLLSHYNLLATKIIGDKRWLLLLYSIILFTYIAFVGEKNGTVDIDGCETGQNILLFYLNGIIGSLACIFLCKAIPVNFTLLSKIGSSTITILGIHGLIILIIKVLTTLSGIVDFRNFSIPAYFIIAIFACLICTYFHSLLLKYCPVVLGKIKKI
ncbi:MAG: acyltransferase family protein [Muribaculaceae bacterium]|nr:acyltransferase family protein [Muribaculaceae bacterium]